MRHTVTAILTSITTPRQPLTLRGNRSIRGTSLGSYSKYNERWPSRFFHPGSNIASSINLFLRWTTPFVLVLACLDETIKTRPKPRDWRQAVPLTKIPYSSQPLYSARRRVPLGFAHPPAPGQSPPSRVVPADPRTSPYRPPKWWHKSRLVRSWGCDQFMISEDLSSSSPTIFKTRARTSSTLEIRTFLPISAKLRVKYVEVSFFISLRGARSSAWLIRPVFPSCKIVSYSQRSAIANLH